MATYLPALDNLNDFLEEGGSLEDSEEVMAVLLQNLEVFGRIIRNIEASDTGGLNKTVLSSLAVTALEQLEALEALIRRSIPVLSHSTYRNVREALSEARSYLLKKVSSG